MTLTDTHLARAQIAADAPKHLQAFLTSVVLFASELEAYAEDLERWAFARRSDRLLVEATRARVRAMRVDEFLGVK